jgi:hypothetical protein
MSVVAQLEATERAVFFDADLNRKTIDTKEHMPFTNQVIPGV